MQIRWHYIYPIFLLALVVAMAGILSAEPAAEAQTTPQDDVQSTAVPGQIAPRLQNPGNGVCAWAQHQPGDAARSRSAGL